MGIKNLHRFIKKHIEPLYQEVDLSAFENISVAIDANVYLFKYKSINKDKWINSFLSLIITLRKYNMKCVFIYDTKAPIEKNARKEERKNRRKNAEQRISDISEAMKQLDNEGIIQPILSTISEKRGIKGMLRIQDEADHVDREAVQKELVSLSNQVVNITRAEVEQSKELLRILGIPHIDSESEAETLCAHLCCHGVVDAVLSDDTDVLVYGTPIFLTKINLKAEQITVLRFDQILEGLKFTASQFTDLCIMSGTDYNDNVPNIGNEKAFKLLQRYESLESIERNREDLDFGILNYKRVREIFAVPPNIPSFDLEYKDPNIEELIGFAQCHRIQLNDERMNVIKRQTE